MLISPHFITSVKTGKIIGNVLFKIWSSQIFDEKIGTTNFHAIKSEFECRCRLEIYRNSSIALEKLIIRLNFSKLGTHIAKMVI